MELITPLTQSVLILCFVSDSFDVVLLPSDTDVELAGDPVCKLIIHGHSNLRVQVGALRPVYSHLFLRLICPDPINVDIYWVHS